MDEMRIARKDMLLNAMNNLFFDKGMISEREYQAVMGKIQRYIDAIKAGG